MLVCAELKPWLTCPCKDKPNRVCGRRFLSTTTATSYSLVGSLNKIPVAVIGLVAFNVPWSVENLASILVGLFAGIIFVKAKQLPPAAGSAK